MYIAIFSHLTLSVHENTSFKTSAGRFISVFRRCAALSADQEKVLSFLPKLSCGFKLVLSWKFYFPKNTNNQLPVVLLHLASYLNFLQSLCTIHTCTGINCKCTCKDTASNFSFRIKDLGGLILEYYRQITVSY